MTDALDALDGRAAVHTTAAAPPGEGQAEVSDDTLLLAYRDGDLAAFERLYERHKQAVYRFFLRQLPQAQAHDGVQDTWTKLIAAKDRYQPRGTFQSYLFTLAHNVLMDMHRRHKFSVVEDLEQLTAPGSEVMEQASRAELRERLREQIARLPVHQRTVWLIKQETQLSLAEIARVTDSSLETVKTRLRYANAKLKAGMQQYVRS